MIVHQKGSRLSAILRTISWSLTFICKLSREEMENMPNPPADHCHRWYHQCEKGKRIGILSPSHLHELPGFGGACHPRGVHNNSLATFPSGYLSLTGERLSRYTLEVIAPQGGDQLTSALDAIATVHGGAVVESSPAGPYQRRFVNIFDCESSLEGEVEWLRSMFPQSRFTLKEYM
jgi:hypothetical protein